MGFGSFMFPVTLSTNLPSLQQRHLSFGEETLKHPPVSLPHCRGSTAPAVLPHTTAPAALPLGTAALGRRGRNRFLPFLPHAANCSDMTWLFAKPAHRFPFCGPLPPLGCCRTFLLHQGCARALFTSRGGTSSLPPCDLGCIHQYVRPLSRPRFPYHSNWSVPPRRVFLNCSSNIRL